jgi:hypothetical protein
MAMPKDLTLSLENRPGSLAELGEALGNAGVNIDGGCAVTGGGRGEIHLLVEDAGPARSAIERAGMEVASERDVLVTDVEDRPGELGRIARSLADAGVNIELLYIAAGTRLVIGADDLEKARASL